MDKTKELIVIVGPTASGKTNLAIELALKHQCEIVSADSRQIYTELNIGVAKPEANQLQAIKHHFINHVSVSESYNAGIYEEEVITVLNNYFKTSNRAILVGGTGLYVQAVLHGLDPFPDVDEAIKTELERDWNEGRQEQLIHELKIKDGVTYHALDLHNPRRVIRALSVMRSTGKKFSDYKTQSKKPRPFKVDYHYLNPDKNSLYHRINQRVDDMMGMGLENEVRQLMPLRHLSALQTVGYTELFTYMEGNCTLDEAVEKIKQHSRNYAKRQITWFNKFTP